MLIQIDGSRDDWLEWSGSCLSLVGAIDDATGKVPYALFQDEVAAQGYTLSLLDAAYCRKPGYTPSSIS